MKSVSEQTILKTIENLNKRRLQFTVQKKRRSHKLILNGRVVMYNKSVIKHRPNQTKQQHNEINSLIAQVAKNVNNYLRKNDMVQPVLQQHPVAAKNPNAWNKLKVGKFFYYIDANHCYWRIAYLEGYISHTLYEKTLQNPDLKLFRNMALACIMASDEVLLYGEGALLQHHVEQKQLHKIIYNNIRFTAFNLMGGLKAHLGAACYGYNTDGIMVPKGKIAVVQQWFEQASWLYTVKKCKKLSRKRYWVVGTDEFKRF